MQIEIQTKKNETVITAWEITQDHPWPDIEGACGSLRWRNAGGILPQYGRPAEGLGTTYTAAMLRPDYDPAKAEGNRRDYAGFDGNPSFTYRGREMGEITAEIRIGQRWPDGGSVYFHRSYSEALTDGERKLLQDQVAPSLIAFVKAHAEALKEQAIDKIKDSVARHLADARVRLAEMEQEMSEAIEML